MPTETTLPPAEATDLASLLAYAPHGIASRVLAKTGGGSVTLFALELGQALSEHTSPFEALVVVLEGALTLTIGGVPARAGAGTVTHMPADVPHALVADARTRMLLVMLRDPGDGGV